MHLNYKWVHFQAGWVSAVVGDPAEAVSSFLHPAGEGLPVRKRLSPYGAVLPDRSSEGPDVGLCLGLRSVRHRSAIVFGKRCLQAGEHSVYAYDIRTMLPCRGGAVQYGIAARADVLQHVLH